MTATTDTAVGLPRKKFFRQRAHSNPLGDHFVEYPVCPDSMDWSTHFPKYFKPNKSNTNGVQNTKRVEVVDIGCGYGGLLISLSKILPDTLCVGMEIRVKVADYVQERIRVLRTPAPTQAITGSNGASNTTEGTCHNVACIRTNAMKYLPNFFARGQLSKAFILFPDPHFKRQKHKWRIVSRTLLAEYAYVMRPGALMYTITDVKEVHDWMVKHFTEHPLFKRVEDPQLADDPCYLATFASTEEGQKVTRNSGDKFPAVFRRVELPPITS